MAIERLVDGGSHEEDRDEQIIEVTLRPQTFADYMSDKSV